MNLVVFGLAAAVLYQLKTLVSHGAAIAIDTPAAGSQRLNRAVAATARPPAAAAAPGSPVDTPGPSGLHAEVSALLAASSAVSVEALEQVIARHRAAGPVAAAAAAELGGHSACDGWGCSCQGFSDTFHAVDKVSFGSASEPQRQWWVKHGCHTAYVRESPRSQ